MIRRAAESDIMAVAAIYSSIHDAEERGDTTTGWIRGVYPTEDTAREALSRGELFVEEHDGAAVGLPSSTGGRSMPMLKAPGGTMLQMMMSWSSIPL